MLCCDQVDFGGSAVDALIVRLLASKIPPEARAAIADSPRLRRRLEAAARNAKHVLSANAEAFADIDAGPGFASLPPQRLALAELAAERARSESVSESAVLARLLHDVLAPVLANNRTGSVGGSASRSVVAVADGRLQALGGATRAPFVRLALEDAAASVGLELAANIDKEEAAALGAAYYAASRLGPRSSGACTALAGGDAAAETDGTTAAVARDAAADLRREQERGFLDRLWRAKAAAESLESLKNALDGCVAAAARIRSDVAGGHGAEALTAALDVLVRSPVLVALIGVLIARCMPAAAHRVPRALVAMLRSSAIRFVSISMNV